MMGDGCGQILEEENEVREDGVRQNLSEEDDALSDGFDEELQQAREKMQKFYNSSSPVLP